MIVGGRGVRGKKVGCDDSLLVSQAQPSMEPNMKPAQEVLSKPTSSATVVPPFQPLGCLPRASPQFKSSSGYHSPHVPFFPPLSILSPSVFSNTSLSVASGVTEDHLILTKPGGLSVSGGTGKRKSAKSRMTKILQDRCLTHKCQENKRNEEKPLS